MFLSLPVVIVISVGFNTMLSITILVKSPYQATIGKIVVKNLATSKNWRYFESNNKAVKIALAFEEQVLDYVPKDPYDVSIDLIVTDQNIYECH